MSVLTLSATASRTSEAANAPYSGFDGQYIGGKWRSGSALASLADYDPYTGQAIAEISLATVADLDAGYASAAGAQRDWARPCPPNARRCSCGLRRSWTRVTRKS